MKKIILFKSFFVLKQITFILFPIMFLLIHSNYTRSFIWKQVHRPLLHVEETSNCVTSARNLFKITDSTFLASRSSSLLTDYSSCKLSYINYHRLNKLSKSHQCKWAAWFLKQRLDCAIATSNYLFDSYRRVSYFLFYFLSNKLFSYLYYINFDIIF